MHTYIDTTVNKLFSMYQYAYYQSHRCIFQTSIEGFAQKGEVF